MRRLAMLTILLPAALQASAGEIREVDTYLNAPNSDAYPGHEFRAQVSEAMLFAQKGNDEAAWTSLAPVLAFCDGKVSMDGVRVLSVSNGNEAQEFESFRWKHISTR